MYKLYRTKLDKNVVDFFLHIRGKPLCATWFSDYNYVEIRTELEKTDIEKIVGQVEIIDECPYCGHSL